MSEKSVDYAQGELDNNSREPHEFTHPVPAYQILASQSNIEPKKTLGLFYTEQSLRNAKASMASESNVVADVTMKKSLMKILLERPMNMKGKNGFLESTSQLEMFKKRSRLSTKRP